MAICNILGMKVAATTLRTAVNTVCRHLTEWNGQYITFVNVHTAVMAHDNKEYLKAQQEAVVSFADGFPIALYERNHGYSEASRVAGPDFMEAVFKKSVKRKYRHYFYGSTWEVLDALQTQLEKMYPGIVISGTYAPVHITEISSSKIEKDIDRINATFPDFVWIGLGAPKQEFWMKEAKGKVQGLMLGVGAGFDFHARRVKRAPGWMQLIGMEWFYRMIQEPRRLVQRYVKTNWKFIKLCIKEKVCK